MVDRHHDGGFGINWELSLDKFLTRSEVKRLRSWAVRQKNEKRKNRLAWFEWFLIELGLNTGLRVFEIADLKCGDVRFRGELSHVFVRNGKCGKEREVRISSEFAKFAQEFLIWKEANNENIGFDEPLFYSPKAKSRYSTRGLQLAFKRCLKKAGISLHHSIHHVRHTYASLLYASSKNNIRLVQKQLGHSSVVTTQVYTNLFNLEMQKAVEKLF